MDVYADKARMDALADGEQTAFNMINALCGVLYLSGRIDKADKFNRQLIKEGTDVYKAYRSHNHTSVSYTHLDVYKRQCLHGSRPLFLPQSAAC